MLKQSTAKCPRQPFLISCEESLKARPLQNTRSLPLTSHAKRGLNDFDGSNNRQPVAVSGSHDTLTFPRHELLIWSSLFIASSRCTLDIRFNICLHGFTDWKKFYARYKRQWKGEKFVFIVVGCANHTLIQTVRLIVERQTVAQSSFSAHSDRRGFRDRFNISGSH